jgi:hypothetical protein
MKVVWENDRPVVAGKDMRSSWPDAPNQERRRQEWLYPVLRVGAINMQAMGYNEWLDEQRGQLADAMIDNLFD